MKFALNFAPHLGLTSPSDGLFLNSAGPDPVDQIGFAHDLGFRAVEDNFYRLRPLAEQKRIGNALRANGMEMGCFLSILVHDRATFSLPPDDVESTLISELLNSIEATQHSGGRHLTVIAGRLSDNVSFQEQMDNAKRNFAQLAKIAERENVVLLVEAISRKRWPDVLLKRVEEANSICEALGTSAVKVLFDVYQCQCETGDIIANFESCWRQIGCIQIADNPGRCEPGTGEINFSNLLSYIKRKGWTGLVELEHAASKPGRDGENLVLETYNQLNLELTTSAPALE